MTLHESHAVMIFSVWPESGTTVQNEGSAGYNGTEVANHYTTTPSGDSAQQWVDGTDKVTYVPFAAINNQTAFSLEFLWLIDKDALNDNIAYMWMKGSIIKVYYEKSVDRLHVYRYRSATYEEYTCTAGIEDGINWYGLQISWGAPGSTPLVKINNSTQSMTHAHAGGGPVWSQDGSYGITIGHHPTSDGAGMDGCTLAIYRHHNTNLSSEDFTDNYNEDWLRTIVDTTIAEAPLTEAVAEQRGVSVEYDTVANSHPPQQ